MAYNNGINFGYDQMFVHPAADNYHMTEPPAARNNIEMDMIKKIKYMETSQNDNSVIQKTAELCNCVDTEREKLRSMLLELQRKNDMLTMFILFLVVVFIIKYNSYSISGHPMYITPPMGTVQMPAPAPAPAPL